MRNRRRYPSEITDGPHAGIKIEHLAQGDVQRANTAAHRSRKRPFDRHAEVADGVHRVRGQPFVKLIEGFLTGKNFKPGDFAFSAISLFNRRIEHAARGFPDVASGTVSLDEGQNGPVWNLKFAARKLDRLAVGRNRYAAVG